MMLGIYKDRNYRFGWKLLLSQNIILILCFLVCIPVFSNEIFRIIASLDMVDYFSRGLNYLFTFALFLDLIAIFLISKSTLSRYLSLKSETNIFNYRNKEFLVSLSGFLWIAFSLLWRTPFYLSGGFDLGYTRGSKLWELENNQFYYNLLNNPLMVIFQVFGGICLLSFFYYQEKIYMNTLSPEEIHNDIGNIGIGRATVYGVLNALGMFFLLLGSNLTPESTNSMEQFGARSNGVFLMLGIFLKISIIPLLAIWTCFKFLSLVKISYSNISSLQKEKKKEGLSILDRLQAEGDESFFEY